MIGQVQTKDGQKIVQPISGSIPTGNPVGTLLTTYKKLRPRNYLYCDGRDTTGTPEELRLYFPALYLYLGTNVLPDYRECVMVGAEENTTDQIADHDVYAQGEFKDDQIQNITGQIKSNGYAVGGNSSAVNEGALFGNDYNKKTASGESSGATYMASINFDASLVARAGITTHSKQKAVYVYIKAVDGVDITDEDTFLVTVKNFVDERVTRAESYSTEEQWTGGYWIDGKKIYRKCKTQQTYSGSGINNIIDLGLNGVVDNLVSLRTITKQSNGEQMGDYCFSSTTLQNCYLKTDGTVQYRAGSSYSYGQTTVIIEYTKTTD